VTAPGRWWADGAGFIAVQSFDLGRPLAVFAVEVQAEPPGPLWLAAGQCLLKWGIAIQPRAHDQKIIR
jgi:hypothetical protein